MRTVCFLAHSRLTEGIPARSPLKGEEYSSLVDKEQGLETGEATTFEFRLRARFLKSGSYWLHFMTNRILKPLK